MATRFIRLGNPLCLRPESEFDFGHILDRAKGGLYLLPRWLNPGSFDSEKTV